MNLNLIKSLKVYIIIILISILFSLYSFEAFLNYQKSANDNLKFKKKMLLQKENKIYDERTTDQYYRYLSNENKDVSVVFYPNYFLKENSIFQPLSGVSNSLTINCNENGYISTYLSDRYGFNNPDKEWDNDEIEYIVIGDSFAHGACVNRPNDISSILRNLTKKKVLNLGYGHNGPLFEYVILREYIQKNTKKILWLYYEGNDQSDLNVELNNKFLNYYLLDNKFSQKLITRQSEVDELIKKKIPDLLRYREELRNKENIKYKILKFIRLDKTKTILRNKKEKFQKKKFIEIMKKANDLAIDNNSKLYFVYLPSYHRYNKLIKDNNYNDFIFIKNSMRDLNIPFIDLHTDLISKNPKAYFPFGLAGHYNENGYKEVGKFLFEKTKEWSD